MSIKAAPLRSAAARRRAGLRLGRPARRTPGQHAQQGTGPARSSARIRRHRRIASALPAAYETGHAWTDTGVSSASDHVALQEGPVKGAPCGRVAEAMAYAPPLTLPPFRAVSGSYRMRHLHASASSQEAGMAQTRFTCTLTRADEPACQAYARITIMDSEGGTARGCPRHAVAALDGIASARVDWADSKGIYEWERKAWSWPRNGANSQLGGDEDRGVVVLDGWEPRWEPRDTSSPLSLNDRADRVPLKFRCCYLGWVVQANPRARHKAWRIL